MSVEQGGGGTETGNGIRKIKDQCLGDIASLKQMVLAENKSQIDKWGIQEATPFEWMTWTTEELGELAQAISEYEYRNGKKSDVIKEAIQTATLCLKIAEIYAGE